MNKKRGIPGVVSPVMATLADYIATALRKPLPSPVAEKTKHHILDTLAAMISGAKLPPGKMAIAYTKRLGGTKEAAVAGSRVVPELIQSQVNPESLARALLDWLEAPDRMATVRKRFGSLHDLLARDTATLATDAIQKTLQG